jgi:non-specific serine/threonine protein kinase
MTAFCRLLGVQGQRAAALRPGWACLDAARQLGEPFLLVEALAVLALNLLCVDRTTTALPLLDEALELAQGIPEVPQALASATLFRGIGAVFDGDLGLARRLLADCQTQCRRHGDLLYLGYALDSSVLVALRSGQAEQAGVLAREAVAVHDSLGDTLGLCLALEFMAWIADAGRDHRRAARMLGATEAQARLLGGSPFSINGLSTTHRACEASARAALGEAAFQAQFRLGEELSANDLIVRDDVAALPAEPTGAHCSELPELTRREVEIAALVARGLSNRDIAGQLVIAQRTAEGHVRNILLKLGFTSRSQIAVWYTKQA